MTNATEAILVADKTNLGAITADDVARLAGVSRWTVNRAFKKDASISQTSLDKVMAASDQLGYVPDLLAASLATNKSNLVSLLVDDFSNPHKLIMMERLTRILRKNGWDTLLVNTNNEEDASAALLNARQRRVDAAVLIGISFNDHALSAAHSAQRVNKLIVFARTSENPDTISICCDDQIAMTTITNYVIEKGYKRPLFLAGPQTISAHLGRKETFSRLWEAQFNVTPDFISVPIYDPVRAYERTKEYLEDLPIEMRPDVIVCENDALAMGAINAIRYAVGLRVPQDIAVTGFDDIPQASGPEYRLTSYRQPITAMAEALVTILKGDDTGETLDKFVGTLISRESA
ncbi:DNA-binding LacI/PurR family transcriptional regulator [Pacificibacter maritimus]|uniref:DNA-binding LacI/PurR family transcriptional regulator n=1 Tax=Pacificibacter maritimus TaxID=762213 RepID=A0A3N4UZV4_9RHOB|nr:LacI family DNA-binding transcriptional regulator [Pacificibacter maritimus]RPE67130.1 DNA-binding LacI/PurR family transcriptional regulator [Pacificibacter maritimus]